MGKFEHGQNLFSSNFDFIFSLMLIDQVIFIQRLAIHPGLEKGHKNIILIIKVKKLMWVSAWREPVCVENKFGVMV